MKPLTFLKYEIIRILGLFLIGAAILYTWFTKDTVDIYASIWESPITYTYIGGALMLFAPIIKRHTSKTKE